MRSKKIRRASTRYKTCAARRLPVEPLEARRLLAAIVVNSLGDMGTLSGNTITLRAAIGIANSSTTPTTITFDPTVFATAQTINLTNGVLAVQNFSESTTITGPAAGVTIRGNDTSTILSDSASTLTLSNLTITQGSVGINSVNANLTLNDVSVIGNAGDGIDDTNGLTLTNSTVANNGLVTGGDGLSVADGPTVSSTLTNDTIAGNDMLGAAFSGSAVLINDTIAGNGGVGIISQSGQITLGNTVLEGNSTNNVPQQGLFASDGLDFSVQTVQVGTLPAASPIKSLGNNFIGNEGVPNQAAGEANWVSSDQVGNPQAVYGGQDVVYRALLGPLGNNGGLTQTMVPQPGSPLINAGSNTIIPAGITTDQRGVARTFGGATDIGAVELNSVPQLVGTPIGTSATYSGGSTIEQVFDGNLGTYFDPANGSLANWVGLDLGKNATLTSISFAPRAGYEFRMLGGQFQVSSTPDFSSDVHTLYTVTTTPTAGVLTTVTVNPAGGYRYVRYTGGTQWVNIAEMEVFGQQMPAQPTSGYDGVPIGTAGSWNPSSGLSAAMDGNPSNDNNGTLNLNTFFDPANGNLTNWVGIDLQTPVVLTRVAFAPRAGYEFRMVGGQFQVSSTPDFSSDVHTIFTVTAAPVSGQLTTVNIEPAGAYRYVRYTGGTQWVNIAEMEFAGPAGPVALSGTAIGAGGSWNPYTTYSAAFDGSTSTFFDPANGNLTNWVGEDLGSAQVVTQIKFAPRTGYESRMIGGMFQASNTADFSSGVVTLATITSAPVAGQVTTVSVNPTNTAYRYYRYIGGTQWVNIAEMELDGL